MQHANLLPPWLTVGETWDLSPQYTIAKDLALVRDASAELVSQSRRVHVPIERPEAPAQATKSVHSLGAESNPGKDEMVTRKMMTINRFMPGA